MGRYDPLFGYLCRSPDDSVTMTFDEIEALVGPLPLSATKYDAWWQNEAANSGHPQAAAWLNAGRTVELADRAHRRVRFSSARWNRGA